MTGRLQFRFLESPKEFLREHSMQTKLMEIKLCLTEKHVDPFVWGDKKEDTHSDRYMEWLKANVSIPSYATLHKTSNQANLLSLHSVSTQYNFNGTLDMAIVDNRYVEKGGSIVPGLLVGIEVKEMVDPKHHMQAIIELLLTIYLFIQVYCPYATLGYERPIPHLLTDTNIHSDTQAVPRKLSSLTLYIGLWQEGKLAPGQTPRVISPPVVIFRRIGVRAEIRTQNRAIQHKASQDGTTKPSPPTAPRKCRISLSSHYASY
jgi:hypothetical protein